MRENKLKLKLKSGGKVFGTWSMTGSPVVANVLGSAGLDFVIIDMEHGAMSFETAEQQLYATEVTGCVPIIRLGEASEPSILHALEIGAQSIMLSHVSTPQDAEKIVQASKYAPEGDRGLSPFTRNHGYSDANMADKLHYANEQMFIGILVEGEEGLNNLEKICAVPGIDMVYLGIYDISQSVGVHGDVRHPRVIKVVQECVKIINSYGLVAGSVARDRDYLKLLIDSGFRFLSYRVDSAILIESFETAMGWFQELISTK
jgi:4-hydroxy-2-oxoheptanedioate aldolase